MQKSLVLGLVALAATTVGVVMITVLKPPGASLAQPVSTQASQGAGSRYENINGVLVPPEPDPVLNNATLAGVDVNGNGVRDDVERWIAISVPTSARHRANLLVDAQANQRGLLASSSDTAVAAALEGLAALACFRYLGISPDRRMWKESLGILLNTPARLRAYDEYQRKISGEVFELKTPGSTSRSDCKFDVESLPN